MRYSVATLLATPIKEWELDELRWFYNNTVAIERNPKSKPARIVLARYARAIVKDEIELRALTCEDASRAVSDCLSEIGIKTQQPCKKTTGFPLQTCEKSNYSIYRYSTQQ